MRVGGVRGYAFWVCVWVVERERVRVCVCVCEREKERDIEQEYVCDSVIRMFSPTVTNHHILCELGAIRISGICYLFPISFSILPLGRSNRQGAQLDHARFSSIVPQFARKI